jgi:hypothetical protein
MKCCICNQDLPEEAFYPSELRGHRKARCKECHKARKRRLNKLSEGIVQRGTHLIIRKDGISRIYWSGNMLSELRRYYPTTKNAELADYFGVSQRTINRKAAELGLTKSKQFIADVSKENGYYALVKQKK